MRNRGLILFFAAFAALLVSFSSTSQAQEYVGVLPEMLEPEVAEQLGLEDDQKDAIRDLIRSRIGAAVGLSQKLREAPVSQHAALRAEFSAESEALGFKLLTPEQKDKLTKYRVEWMGLLALDEPQVAQALNLADWQKELVSQWRNKVRAERRSDAAERTRAEAERAIRQEISDSQFAAWQQLAGQIDDSPAGVPAPPERAVAAAQPEEATAVAQPRSTPVASAEENADVPVEDVQLMLNFESAPWKDAIEWLAEQADLSVQSDVIPPGTFKYRDKSRTYSVTENA